MCGENLKSWGSGEQEERVINRVGGIRDGEYDEIHRETAKFVAEIEKEVRINMFTTEELEEEESEMVEHPLFE